MNITIDYLPEEAQGRLKASPDVPSYVWARVKDLMLGFQPDASMIGSTIICDWVSVLGIASGLADVRERFGVQVIFGSQASPLFRRYVEESKCITNARDRLYRNVTSLDIDSELRQKGFTERILNPEQKRDLLKVLSLPHAANFSVPGAGKTTVAFAAHLLAADAETFLLVVAPKNAFPAWDEVITDCMHPTKASSWGFVRLTGGASSISALLRTGQKRFIISYDQLARVQAQIAHFLGTHKVHLILDESHRMKAGDRSQRGNALLRLAHLPVRRDILSGTPIPRILQDIVPQVDFLWPGHGLGTRVSESARPHDVLEPLYVRTTKQELDLPRPERVFLHVPMSNPQVALYSLVRDEFLKRVAGLKVRGNIDLVAAKKSVIRLLQISSNPLLYVQSVTEGQLDEFAHDDPKLRAIFIAIQEEWDGPKIRRACELARHLAALGQKAVIWTSFTYNVERIASQLSDVGATFIHGKVNAGEYDDENTREGRLAKFKSADNRCMVLVANPAACSEGISLHKVCHNAIYLDRTFNAGHYLQSVDRIHRLGLDKQVTTTVFVLESVAPSSIGSVDFSVRRRLVTKLRVMSDALNDADLQQLALDEEEGDIPADFDISQEDILDIVDELTGKAKPSEYEEDYPW